MACMSTPGTPAERESTEAGESLTQYVLILAPLVVAIAMAAASVVLAGLY